MKISIQTTAHRFFSTSSAFFLAAFILSGCATSPSASDTAGDKQTAQEITRDPTRLAIPQRPAEPDAALVEAEPSIESATQLDDSAVSMQPLTQDPATTQDPAAMQTTGELQQSAASTPYPFATDATTDNLNSATAENISAVTRNAELGYIDAQVELGIAYKEGIRVEQDFEQARRWLESASAQGDRFAQYELGQMYYYGTGVKQDYLNARELWIESAISGHDKAQQKLGYLYSEGLGVEQNYSTAKNWYLRAANLGNAEAQTLLGSLYHEGNRIPQNYPEAVKWYRLAAQQGHPHSQYTLAILYHDGLGTEADMVKCAAWVNVAVANGYPDDLDAGAACRKDLDARSLEMVNELSEQWILEFSSSKNIYQ